ncbi:helix-turn-helix domain-containing protein [Homoserinibacter sp. YIM 151385]|uniref:helix-turn-helix domain-containing protein n=1 Tax=Homoserinibacter sp. YIM 151385 TaxID=2985506 RepID=UPI0022F0F466|nr:helix-turn-helix domain-containing protein [Homoserinibacter sp. YIM 151385]WBU37819.1 helix-turn-helix domain-containing protein [Homoserinibacter sp. YIM 151385]
MNGIGRQDRALARFLTLLDVAEILRISVVEASALVRAGEIPAIQVGTRAHWRVERDHLEAYIEARYEEARLAGRWNELAERADDIVDIFAGRRRG